MPMLSCLGLRSHPGSQCRSTGDASRQRWLRAEICDVVAAAWQVGQKIKVQINRQGRPQAVELTLAERDPSMD